MPPVVVKLAPNVPATIRPVYVDVVSGQYGEQLRLKGEVKGTSKTPADLASIYVPVDLAADLVRAGWTPETRKGPDGADVQSYRSPDKGASWWVVVRKQEAGAKTSKTEMAPEHGWPDDEQALPETPASAPAAASAQAPALTQYAKVKALEAAADESLDWALKATRRAIKECGDEMEAAIASDKPVPTVTLDAGHMLGSLFGTRLIAKGKLIGY